MLALGLLMAASPFVLGKLSARILRRFKRLQAIAYAVEDVRQFNTLELLITILIWICVAAMLGCITAAMNLPLSLEQLFFLVAVQLGMQLFPIQGFANSGNHEGGWVAALIAIGYSTDVALKISLASHAIILLFVLFLGVVAFFMRFLRNRRQVS